MKEKIPRFLSITIKIIVLICGPLTFLVFALCVIWTNEHDTFYIKMAITSFITMISIGLSVALFCLLDELI